MNVNNYREGIYNINNTVFKNMNSESGSIIHIDSTGDKTTSEIKINNSKFENVTANRYGGIIYSLSKLTPSFVSFNDCEFKMTKAYIGNIAYSLDKYSEPYISNVNELKQIKGNMASNPTNIKINEEYKDIIELYSGEKLPDNITCNITYKYIYLNLKYVV